MSLPLAFVFYLLFFTKEEKHLKVYSLIPCILLTVYIVISLFVPACKVDSFRAAVGLNPQFRSIITGTYTGESITAGHLIMRYIEKTIHFLRGYGLTLIPQALIRSAYDMYEMNKLKAIIMALITTIVATGWYATLKKYRLMNLFKLSNSMHHRSIWSTAECALK